MATAATIAAELKLTTAGYDKGLSDAEKKAESFEKKMTGIGKTMTKVGGIMTAALTAPIIAGMTKSVMAAGDLEQATVPLKLCLAMQRILSLGFQIRLQQWLDWLNRTISSYRPKPELCY